MKTIYRLIREDEGVSLAEEGLLVALVALAAIAGITLLGQNLQAIFASIAGTVGAAA